MLDALTLDQLRTFIAAAEEGSFSAAGRRLGRAQSVVSQTMANLELQLGVKLFDRSARSPRLTEEGNALLQDARRVLDDMDAFKGRARAMREGLEAELSVAMDVMYPMEALTRAADNNQRHFPHTPLRLYVEALGGVVKLVSEGVCQLGIVGTLPLITDDLRTQPLGRIQLVTVASPGHPLSKLPQPLCLQDVSRHAQLVLTDRTSFSEGRNFGVLSPTTWRLADLGAKHAFLKAGLGWGNMPLHMVEDDLANGSLVRLQVHAGQDGEYLSMFAVYRKDAPPGPAGRAFIECLRAQP